MEGAAPAAQPDHVYLDGPYGAPAETVFDAKVVVLIASGIGVTPFASILQSLLARCRAAPGQAPPLDKIYFFWLNRDQKAFEWFIGLLRALERLAPRDLIEINVCLTGVKPAITSTSLAIAMDLVHRETGRDLLTGLAARTRLDRPDWRRNFARIAQAHDEVEVFFCGPPALSRQLKRLARQFGFAYRKENF